MLALYLLAAFVIGWMAGRSAPLGVERYYWIRMKRRFVRRARITHTHSGD